MWTFVAVVVGVAGGLFLRHLQNGGDRSHPLPDTRLGRLQDRMSTWSHSTSSGVGRLIGGGLVLAGGALGSLVAALLGKSSDGFEVGLLVTLVVTLPLVIFFVISSIRRDRRRPRPVLTRRVTGPQPPTGTPNVNTSARPPG